VSSRPRMTVRQFDVVVSGQSATDASVQREVRETVRVRNDMFSGNCPAV
jgi:prepilin peptidase dependent protein B